MQPKTPKRITKPTFKPTDDERKLVEQMCAVGIPQESICLVVRDGIDDKTLRKHFRRELDTAKIKANAKIGGTLFNKAVNGDTTAAIFWAKTQMGWKETSHTELSGDLDHQVTIQFEPSGKDV
tara:strand:+ start:1297 stop:1665 length:369 start_codon:yes stop_codon:yes gene_type:complete